MLRVIFIDDDVGLYLGVGSTLLLIIFRSQRPRITVMGNIPNTDVYESVDVCSEAQEIADTKILRFEESVYYANVENFKYKIIKFSDTNLILNLKVLRKLIGKKEKLNQKFQVINIILAL